MPGPAPVRSAKRSFAAPRPAAGRNFVSHYERVLTLAALLAATPAAAGVTVTLHARAAPAGGVVRLADVATLTPDAPADAPAAARLAALPLAPAPAEGRTATLSAAAVRGRAEAGGFAVTLAGAKTVALSAAKPAGGREDRDRPASPGDRAYADKFVTAAVSRALARGGAGPLRVEVALAPDAARALARQRPDGCELTGLTAQPHRAQTVTLRWLDRTDRVIAVAAAVRLTPPGLVPVLVRPVPRGAAVTADHLAWRPETEPGSPVTRATGNLPAALPGFSVRDGAALRGEAVRDLPAGAVLEADDLRAVPLVRANQTVRVESRVGGVTVARDLKATRNGTLGQTVPLADPVRGPDGRRRQIFARVVGNRRAVLVGDAATSAPYASAPYASAGGTR